MIRPAALGLALLAALLAACAAPPPEATPAPTPSLAPLAATVEAGAATSQAGAATAQAAAATAQAAAAGPPAPAGPGVTVDAGQGRRPISPDIYGISFPDPALARELRIGVQRWGGNAVTRYNWQIDVTNRASDYFFQNIPEGDGQGLPAQSGANRFVREARAAGAQAMLTVPLIGFTPARRPPGDSHPYDCGFQVSRYGPQQATDPYDPDCGNGLTPDGAPITGNDPADTSIPIDETFVSDWVAHLVAQHGPAADGGVAYYALDNEPGLWHITHRDVRPDPASYAEIRDLGVSYAAAIKAADPGALVFGPVQDGWTRYFYASYTQEADRRQNEEDRAAHGGTPFVAWYLAEMRRAEEERGLRLLDYLDLHYYPQAQSVALAPAGDPATRALRLRSTRSLWDPSYVDESWIANSEGGGTAVELIPRMRRWVDEHYPGTKLALTEYNWGALDAIDGALAQADVLGIFGREGLDLAALWQPPGPQQPGAFAFRMFRNYDGRGGSFGETSVAASSELSPDQLGAYAAERADGALTVVLVNKGPQALELPLRLEGFAPAAAAEVYRYSAADLSRVVRQPDVPLREGAIGLALPPESITTVVIPAGE